jgi:hypothetical protein
MASIASVLTTKNCNLQLEKAYLHWIKHFIYFNGKRHPQELGELEVARFLTYLVTELKVPLAAQNQALFAITFMYRHVLMMDLSKMPCQLAKNTEQLSHKRLQSYQYTKRAMTQLTPTLDNSSMVDNQFILWPLQN